MNKDIRKENYGGWKMDVRGSESGMHMSGRWGMGAIKSPQSSEMGPV